MHKYIVIPSEGQALLKQALPQHLGSGKSNNVYFQEGAALANWLEPLFWFLVHFLNLIKMFSSDMPLLFTYPPVVYRHTSSRQVTSSPPSSPRPSTRAGLHAAAHQESWPGAGSGGCAPVSERFWQPRAWGFLGFCEGRMSESIRGNSCARWALSW